MQIADIEFCAPADVEELFAIECECFDSPWERRIIENDLHNNLGSVLYLKATFKERVAGYAVMSRNDRVTHILNLAVRPEYRARGVGAQLMCAMGEISGEWRCTRMRLEVRSSNRLGRNFYAQFGFQHMTRLYGYYEDGEDALVLVARLPLAIS